MLHVDDDEVETRMGEQLDRLEGRDLDPRAQQPPARAANAAHETLDHRESPPLVLCRVYAFGSDAKKRLHDRATLRDRAACCPSGQAQDQNFAVTAK
jgi:hypothetical protein